MAPHPPPRLELPSAALHTSTHRELHVDSEEFVKFERRRVARELEPIHCLESLRKSSKARSTIPRENLRRYDASPNDTRSQPDASEFSRRSTRSFLKRPHWYDFIAKFWNTHISITIDEGAHRDHLALERTFLGYLRTSLILVMTGVLIAQLFRLQHAANPNTHLGFYIIGRPLSITFIGMGILVVIVGAYRFWKLQHAMVRGKARTGGWEVLLIMGMSMLLLIVTFGLILGVNIEKSLENN